MKQRLLFSRNHINNLFLPICFLLTFFSCKPSIDFYSEPAPIVYNGFHMFLLPGVKEEDLDNSIQDIEFIIEGILATDEINPKKTKESVLLSDFKIMDLITQITERQKIPNISVCDESSIKLVQEVFPDLKKMK